MNTVQHSISPDRPAGGLSQTGGNQLAAGESGRAGGPADHGRGEIDHGLLKKAADRRCVGRRAVVISRNSTEKTAPKLTVYKKPGSIDNLAAFLFIMD